MKSTADQEIVDLETRFWNTMRTRDVDAAVQLMADRCVLTGAQGASTLDKQTFAKVMAGGKWELKEFSFEDVQVERPAADVAVIGYKVREKLIVEGKPLDFEAADSSTWIRKDDRWLCAVHTESVLGDPFGRDRKPIRS